MLPTALLSFPSARDSNPDMRLHLPRGFLAHQDATENLARQWIERIRDFIGFGGTPPAREKLVYH